MKTTPYPKASIQKIDCPRCESTEVEHGGYRKRKLRTVSGIEERKVMKLRCRVCKQHLKCIYPSDTPRHSWYSLKMHALMTILSVHHVVEGCIEEITELFGYPLDLKTRQAWQDSRVRRIEQQERAYQPFVFEPDLVSIDEFKLASSWVYTVTDTSSSFICNYAVTDKRNFFVIRDLIAQIEPKAVIADGCKSIQAAMHWFSYIPHGRCWFHVMRDVAKKLEKNKRPELIADLQVLYETKTLPAAQRWYYKLMDKYDKQILMPLHNAWAQLKYYWKLEIMPLTNNCSEHLYAKLWARQRKRDKRTDNRRNAWLSEAVWRHNHKPIQGKTPFQSFFNLEANCHKLSWLEFILPKAHTTFP